MCTYTITLRVLFRVLRVVAETGCLQRSNHSRYHGDAERIDSFEVVFE